LIEAGRLTPRVLRSVAPHYVDLASVFVFDDASTLIFVDHPENKERALTGDALQS
jgi:hypothetical protein